ncbi:MAG TPA: pyridoxal phosphate-dependent aminotransferase [Gammaproteobacteria bacterium]|nr:pyridoxal phosphate-dependent aminotransferase [Gammaproteobacteria bacterium]
MHLQLADRTLRVKPSATLAVAAKAAQLRSQGIDIIDLGLGEPDFDTPQLVKQAAIDAVNAGFTKYTPVDGIPELKQAIIHKFMRDNQLTYTPKQILVSVGAKHSLYNLTQALLNAGDEVIVPAPYWVSYPEFARLADAEPVFIKADIKQDFKITATQLSSAITSKTRLIFLNSPSNPTGVTYTLDELKALGEVLRLHPHIIIATDDIYEHIFWGNEPFANILNACPYLYDRTVVINGMSKAYAMTGWRIGYAAGPEVLIQAMNKIQSQSTSNPCAIAQKASVAALNMELGLIKDMVQAFKARHDYIVQAINEIPGLACVPAQGAFYAFIHAQEYMDAHNMADDIELANFLTEKAHVAMVPGSAFGLPGYLRLSYATSMEKLKEAVRRIKAA